MYTKQPKKILIMNILEILQKYSDENHRLSQKEISNILKVEYDMEADRKTIRRNILDLMDFGYEIEYSETIRMTPNSKTGELEESYVWSDFYLVRTFTDGELRLLIDGLLFSKHVPYNQCKELIKKLEGLSNNYFHSRVKHISRIPDDKTDNKQLFLNIELLDEAISKKRRLYLITWNMAQIKNSMLKRIQTEVRKNISLRHIRWLQKKVNIILSATMTNMMMYPTIDLTELKI